MAATILPFLKNQGVFEPDMTSAMSAAFEAACKELELTNGADSEREAVAVHIIELARRGERDPKRLCAHAVRECGAR